LAALAQGLFHAPTVDAGFVKHGDLGPRGIGAIACGIPVCSTYALNQKSCPAENSSIVACHLLLLFARYSGRLLSHGLGQGGHRRGWYEEATLGAIRAAQRPAPGVLCPINS